VIDPINFFLLGYRV